MNDSGQNGIVKTAQMTLDETPPNLREAGVSATFAKMAGGMPLGVKSFQHEDERDRSYVIQEYLAKFGLAPKVFAKFDTVDHGHTRYCLVTECVEQIGANLRRYDESDEDRRAINMAHTLRDRIVAVGLHPEDLHYANWGTLNGKAVAIDVAYFRINMAYFERTGNTPPDCDRDREYH